MSLCIPSNKASYNGTQGKRPRDRDISIARPKPAHGHTRGLLLPGRHDRPLLLLGVRHHPVPHGREEHLHPEGETVRPGATEVKRGEEEGGGTRGEGAPVVLTLLPTGSAVDTAVVGSSVHQDSDEHTTRNHRARFR